MVGCGGGLLRAGAPVLKQLQQIIYVNVVIHNNVSNTCARCRVATVDVGTAGFGLGSRCPDHTGVAVDSDDDAEAVPTLWTLNQTGRGFGGSPGKAPR